jgi:xylulokinase
MTAAAGRTLAERHTLAVDLGTGGPKVGLVSFDGRLRWSAHRAVATVQREGGVAVQDAAAWWDAVTDLAREGVRVGGVEPASIEAVAVTGQWGSTVPVDADGLPVGDCRLFLDTRGARHTASFAAGPFVGYHPRALVWLQHTAGAPSPQGGDPVGHMLSIQRDEPQVAARARWFLEPVDYLTMRFTGRPTASHNSMTLAWLTDNRHPSRLDYDERLVRWTGIDPHRLPPLVRTGSVVGPVLPEVCRALGLSDGTVAVTGVNDLLASTVGSGAVLPRQGHFAVSTTTWISAPVAKKKTDILHTIATVPGLTSDAHLLANNHETAGAALAWVRDELFGGSFDDLTAAAARSPVGSSGVLFTPWLAGLRSPVDDRSARGGWHNVSLANGRDDLVRSVLEGVAYNTRWLLEPVERFVGQRLDPLRFIGGGALSDLWCQIHADITGRRIERVADPVNAPLRGAGLIAAIALGATTLPEAGAGVVVDRTFVPDPAARTTYASGYREFTAMYRRQKGLWRALSR